MRKFLDVVGQRYGRLVAIERVPDSGRTTWRFRCDCGTEQNIRLDSVRRGQTQSCGCLNLEAASDTGRKTIVNAIAANRTNGWPSRTHGKSRTPIHRTWRAMLNRCYNQNVPEYRYYGGRGISVCERWHKFENFYADVGDRPNGLSIDRINNDGNYEPGNVRWATRLQQARNRREYSGKSGFKGVYPTKDGKFRALIEFKGKRLTLGRWSTPADAGATYRHIARALRGEIARGT